MGAIEARVEVSVIIPAYNAATYIAEAIESVIHQKGNHTIELIVVDDCSKDETAKIVQGYADRIAHAKEENIACPVKELRYHKNKRNSGVAESRNYGIRNARGTYLAFLDADDYWSIDKLDRQLELMKSKDCPLCCTGRELIHADGTSKGKIIGVKESIHYKMLLHTNSIPCSSVLMRSEIAREFMMVHDELHEDYILWLQVTKKYGEVCGINEPMLKCRLSEGGKSRNKLKSAKMHFGVYRYMGINPVLSVWYFLCYAVNGVLKYR